MEFASPEEETPSSSSSSSSQSDSFSSRFWTHFSCKQADISSSLEQLSLTPDGITAVKGLISELQDFVTSSAIDLPKYDLRRSQEEVSKLKKAADAKGNAVQPKKKFAFSTRSKVKKNTEKASADTEEEKRKTAEEGVCSVEDTKRTESVASYMTGKSICVKNRTDEASIDVTEEVEGDAGYQVYIENCKNSTISVRTVIGSARLENLQHCHVYLGPCCTSTYVENCTNCVFFIRCHQLRIHHAYDSQFYVLVNSHPIIEDCTTLKFAPYSVFYSKLDEDLKVAKLSAATNWDNVVDFRWHRTTASPNWSVLPQEDRMQSTDVAGWKFKLADDDDEEEF